VGGVHYSTQPTIIPAVSDLGSASGLEGAAGVAEAIELRGIKKSWRGPSGPVHAVRGIDVSIARGETVALLGPNGAGKSTTIDMILGLARPDGGSVSVFGRAPKEAVKQGLVGGMLQTGELIRNLTVRELLQMVASLYPRPLDVDEVLELAGLEQAATQSTHKLSGGQTQRARFGVAIVSNPELLILDEPTVAMDVEGRRTFWSAMRGYAAGGKTVLFATHYLEEADANADRAVLLAHGDVVADGPTTEIKGRVGTRTIRATLPGPELSELEALPGVSSADRHGDAVILVCSDSDRAIRALLERYSTARDIEITGAGLEDAFLRLTGEPDSEAPPVSETVESAR
jgi:ABC-2 type transport system ATP-binding protein